MTLMTHRTLFSISKFINSKFKIGCKELKMEREIYLHNEISLFTEIGSNVGFAVCQNRDFAQKTGFLTQNSNDHERYSMICPSGKFDKIILHKEDNGHEMPTQIPLPYFSHPFSLYQRTDWRTPSSSVHCGS